MRLNLSRFTVRPLRSDGDQPRSRFSVRLTEMFRPPARAKADPLDDPVWAKSSGSLHAEVLRHLHLRSEPAHARRSCSYRLAAPHGGEGSRTRFPAGRVGAAFHRIAVLRQQSPLCPATCISSFRVRRRKADTEGGRVHAREQLVRAREKAVQGGGGRVVHR